MNVKKIILATAVSSVMASGAFAANQDVNTNGLFETKNISPGLNPADFDGATANGSDYWAWTVFGAGPKSDSRQFTVSGLDAGEASLQFTWTSGNGSDVTSLYNANAAGWEPDPQLAPLIANPTVQPVTDPSVLINGVAVAMNSTYVLTGVANGDVVTIATAWTATAGGTNAGMGAVVGVVNPSEVPVPAAAWLFGSALVGLAGVGRKRKTV